MSDVAVIRLIGLICLIVPIVLSVVFTPVSIGLAKKIGAIDTPQDDRRMHNKPIPRFGGMAIFIAAIVMLALIISIMHRFLPGQYTVDEPIGKLFGVIIGGILIYLVGVYDDLKGMLPIVKFLCQVACAAVTFFLGVRIPAISLLGLNFGGDTVGSFVISLIVTVIWIVIITNTINLIDGIDGLAAGVATIAAFSIGYTAYIHGQYVVTFAMIAIAGSALGFLPFNFYPAKVFMGDSGSLFLGFMLASVSVIGPAKASTLLATIVPVLVLGVPLFDVLFAVFRRASRGKPIFAADKGHIHHQLHYIGMGQRRSVLMVYGISCVMGISAIMFSRQLYVEAMFLFLVAILFIIILIWGWNKTGK